ncbi:hypothetical protein RD792_002319 [Penstemon davidsonii]|uniref:Ubiquitin-like domain-containing protein n=1 Tax=Penstemon davidsonii TaxID=160366 RepID=A0ABR0DQQ8_9LAMI|nr:hypothetical protein RD792_002319 [Penstemon davidsonii]
MMKRRLNYFNGRKSEGAETTTSSDSKEDEVEWEMRPGGMLVQKRCDNSELISALPNLRIRVAHGALRYLISANSQSTFGELKKLLTAETGLQPDEQRLVFRGNVRENGDYLDMCGVKDRAKVILIEDPESKARKMIEMRRNAKIQATHRLIDDVSMEVNRLEEQVCAIEKSVANGSKVADLQITTLIEMLMRQAVKLDSIPGDGDACAKKDLQGKRVQKCVEKLDVLKNWDSSVTHVITCTDENGACRRTLEFLMAVLEGKWALSVQWLKACIEAGELVDEQPYEIAVDIHGVKDGPRLGRLRLLNKAHTPDLDRNLQLFRSEYRHIELPDKCMPSNTIRSSTVDVVMQRL